MSPAIAAVKNIRRRICFDPTLAALSGQPLLSSSGANFDCFREEPYAKGTHSKGKRAFAVMEVLDQWMIAVLPPLGIWIVFCGLDDLFLDSVCLTRWTLYRLGKRKIIPRPTERELSELPQKRIAIFVPLWKEHEVIAHMVEHNVSALNYRQYDFFIGIYPNDHNTVRTVQELESRFSNVHSAPAPHDGPTSKADNLNWTYQRMLLFEEQSGCRFDAMVMHDAEDLIHPEALRWLNYYLETHDMIQVPVLALPTPLWQFTHGVYCDEFVEYQTRDLFARYVLGGFIPSSGVGTAFSRYALERLAETASNQIFIPGSLTEDYEAGLRLHELKCPQLFIPIRQSNGNFVATWEYFPHKFKAAVRQRTRWVTGISLQSWETNGWPLKLGLGYWFWRDRKGLLGNPTSMLANIILLYGSATWVYCTVEGLPWGLAAIAGEMWALVLLWATLFLQMWRTGFRMAAVSRVYGWTFASGVPLRMFWSNWMNCFATVNAVYRFSQIRMRGGQLKWAKTEHSYPNRESLVAFKPQLGQILVRSGAIEEQALNEALGSKPVALRLGEYLIHVGLLDEDRLYESLSLQQNVPRYFPSAEDNPRRFARILPSEVMRHHQLAPFRIEAGCLFLASPEVPGDETRRILRQQTPLTLRFFLITPLAFASLTASLEPEPEQGRAVGA